MAYRPNNPFAALGQGFLGGPSGATPPPRMPSFPPSGLPGYSIDDPTQTPNLPPDIPSNPDQQNPNQTPGTPPSSCPAGQVIVNGQCRFPGDYPCPPGTCKDVGSGACRQPGANEKVNETDDIERDTGGGRGYCRQRSGGGGGGGAGGPAAPRPPSFADPANLQSDIIWQEILKRLNAPSRYTPEVMSAFKGEIKGQGDRERELQVQASDESLQRRGLIRSPIAAEAERQIRGNVSQGMLAENNKLMRAKIDADYQDKSQAIKEGMDWINSLRDFVARSSATRAQYDVGMANVQLGYARLQQEMSMLREQYTQNLSLCIAAGICR